MPTTNDVAILNSEDKFQEQKSNNTKILGAVAAFSGFGAVLASSCCVLPLVLAGIGVSASVFSVFQRLAEWKYPLLGIASISLLCGWYSWWRKRETDNCSTAECSSNTRTTTAIPLLSISTVLVIIALSWGYFEPMLLKIIKGYT